MGRGGQSPGRGVSMGHPLSPPGNPRDRWVFSDENDIYIYICLFRIKVLESGMKPTSPFGGDHVVGFFSLVLLSLPKSRVSRCPAMIRRRSASSWCSSRIPCSSRSTGPPSSRASTWPCKSSPPPSSRCPRSTGSGNTLGTWGAWSVNGWTQGCGVVCGTVGGYDS